MSANEASKLAQLAQGQAIGAVNVIQRHGVNTDADRYDELLALAVANLSQAIVELTKSR